MVMCGDKAAYRALTKRFERWRESTGNDLAHVSIPYPDGARLVLTEAEIGGEALDTAPAALRARLEAFLVGASTEKRARLDGSKNWQKREAGRTAKRSASKWTKVGETKKNPVEQAEIFARFDCEPVKTVFVSAGSRRATEYKVDHLSEVKREQLWWSLGWLHEERKMAA
jgi:hypothetical protein